jgi:two-component system nitrate/nitrite response regulator NarL
MDTVVLVIRSQLLRDVVRHLLTESGFYVQHEAAEGESVLSVLRQDERKIDFVIVDAALCGEERHLPKEFSEVIGEGRVVVLSDIDTLQRISREDIAFAAGVITCDITSEAMIQALRLIQSGERVMLRDLMLSLTAGGPGHSPPDGNGAHTVARHEHGPTPRETEILKYLLGGCSNKRIARGLGITEATVKVHLKALLRKIRATNRTQAAIWAANNGYSQSSPTAGDSAR